MSTSREAFAQQVMDFLKQEGEQRAMTVHEGTFTLIAGDGQDGTSFAYLGHLYKEYVEANGENAPRLFKRRLWSMVRRAGELDRERVLSAVLPRCRDRAWFSAVRRQAELELGGDEPVIDTLMLPHAELNDELAVHLAYELPTSVTELGNETLQSWGVPFELLLKRAVENLRQRSLEGFEEAEPGVFLSPFRDTLDASRMLLTDDIAELPVKGAPIALAPTHDTLFITGEEDAQGLQTMAAWAEEALLEPRPHTAIAFKLDAGRWTPWLPPMTHPAWAKLKMLSLQTVASAYARQKEILDALLTANGHDIFVATLRAFRTPSSHIFTACAWTDGVEALLPQTDRIDFIRMPPDGDTKNATVWSTSFEVAQRYVGELMIPTGDVPQRFRVAAFPEQPTLEKMVDEGKLPSP